MALPEIGLKLLLSSVNSSIVARAACCSIGLALPVYSTFKAIENNDPYQQQRILKLVGWE
uniref:HVA22-like protein k n=1 Tax=Cajanus cajan TaxID=3821 RepID=A0A151TG83_CAJCA|nr:HVA22-like protein k [Cajanus cajan]